MGETTIRDIAKACGVGVSTVSRAINNHPDVNPKTKEMILSVVRDMRFVPNETARYLKRTESNAVALLVKGISNPFFSGMIRIIERMVEEKGYALILRHVDSNEDEVAVAQGLVRERKIRGIVFLGGKFVHDRAMLERLPVPFVFSTIGNLDGEKNEKGIANIAVDDVGAARNAISYLIGEGHTKIGIIAVGLHVKSVGLLRYRGYCEALEAAGIPLDPKLVYEISNGADPYTMKNGYMAAKELLAANPEMTAIFCIADVMAIGAARAVAESGRRIPEDVSIVGYDGIEAGDYYIPKLTTVEQPVKALAEETAAHLFAMMEEQAEPANRIMEARLVVKESSGPCRTKKGGTK